MEAALKEGLAREAAETRLQTEQAMRTLRQKAYPITNRLDTSTAEANKN
jgi:hypothetical protein